MSEQSVCPANINAKGRRRRLMMGLVALAVTLVAHFAFVRHHDRLWVLAEFPVFFYAWLCIVQAVDRHCVVLAAQGKHETDHGVEPLGDAAIAAALRKRSFMVYVKADVAAMACVAALYFLGPWLNDVLRA